jgi:acyl carrier protein
MPTDQTSQTILDGLKDALIELGSDPQHVTSDATFQALDIDSLDLAELAQIIDEQWGVQLNGRDVIQVNTVGELARLIQSRA